VLCVAAPLTAVAIAVLASSAMLAQPLTLTSGPYVVVADENVANYRVIVHQSPERVIVGTLTYAVQVHVRETNANVPDAIVKVYATPSEHGARQVAPALNSPADREYYVGRLEIEDKGVWAIDVMIEHPEHGNAALILATEVFERSRGGSNLVLGTILWVFVSIAFVSIAFYLVRKSKRARTELEQIHNQRQQPQG
jgi:hypothetical protein